MLTKKNGGGDGEMSGTPPVFMGKNCCHGDGYPKNRSWEQRRRSARTVLTMGRGERSSGEKKGAEPGAAYGLHVSFILRRGSKRRHEK